MPSTSVAKWLSCWPELFVASWSRQGLDHENILGVLIDPRISRVCEISSSGSGCPPGTSSTTEIADLGFVSAARIRGHVRGLVRKLSVEDGAAEVEVKRGWGDRI